MPLSLPGKNIRIIRILMGFFQSINVSVNNCSTKIEKHCSHSCNYTNAPAPALPRLSDWEGSSLVLFSYLHLWFHFSKMFLYGLTGSVYLVLVPET